MRLVDSSVWIEFLRGTDFGVRLGGMLPMREEWLVPTIVQLELAKWLTRHFDSHQSNRWIAFTQTCVVAELTAPIALAAAAYCAQFRLATADAIIYATAASYSADLLTCDKHFEGLEGVIFMPKPE